MEKFVTRMSGGSSTMSHRTSISVWRGSEKRASRSAMARACAESSRAASSGSFLREATMRTWSSTRSRTLCATLFAPLGVFGGLTVPRVALVSRPNHSGVPAACSRFSAFRRRDIWSSTSALVGYNTRARTAAGRVSVERSEIPGAQAAPSHHVFAVGCLAQPTLSETRRSRIGSRKASVLPEPVPDVTIGLRRSAVPLWKVAHTASA